MNEFINSYFEENNIRCCLSEYYIKVVKDMISQLLFSKPGKRLWVESNNNKGWSYDYTITERSTFPDWSKFFFEKSKYSKNGNINNILEDGRYLLQKGFNGNSKEFINILNKSLNKGLTERQGNALEEAFSNFMSYMNDYKEMYQENYLQEENYIIFYDELGKIIGIEEKNMI